MLTSRRFRGASPVLLALAALVPVSCGDDASAPEGVVEGDCSAFVETLDAVPADDYEEVAGVAALPTSSVRAGPVTGPTGTAQEGLHFAKFGLLVRDDVTVEIVAAATSTGRTLVDWALTGPTDGRDAVTGMRLTSCGGGGWLVFAGGVWVESPGTVTLRVTSDERTADHPVTINRAW